jgi:hypothetical protein
MSIKVVAKLPKHAKLWPKNAFDDCQKYQSYDTKKSITNLFKNKHLIKDLVETLSLFVFQIAKKDILQFCSFHFVSFNFPLFYCFICNFFSWVHIPNLFLCFVVITFGF